MSENIINEPKFTPGPWYIMGDDEHPEGVPVIEISRGHCPSPEYEQIAYVQPFMDDDDDYFLTDEVRANAALIAAAPELYEALKQIVSDWDGEPEDMYSARAAIAKAEGRS